MSTFMRVALPLCLTVALAFPGNAHTQPEWDVLLYLDEGTLYSFMLAVNTQTSEIIELPQELYVTIQDRSRGAEDVYPEFITTGARLSPDGRYLAVSIRSQVSVLDTPVLIADLEQQICCLVVNPLPITRDINLGDFDPSGTRLALSYVGQSAEGTPDIGGMMIVDVANGAQVQVNISMDDVNNALPDDIALGIWAIMGGWEPDGVRFFPNCYACEGAFEGEYALWDPDTGVFTAHSGEYFNSFGERLPATGEMLLVVNDPRFLFDPEPGLFPLPNVVTYAPSGAPSGPDTSVIYFDPETLDVGQAHWIMDGRAVLVIPPDVDFWVIVYRDGAISRYPRLAGIRFLTGTPDGWLALSGDEEGNITVLHFTDQQGSPNLVATIGSGYGITVVQRPELGMGLDLPPFVPVPPPSPEELAAVATPAMTSCPGLLPSRLVVGGQGRVTPGDPNRLRDQPTLVNSAIIGQMPGGATFDVLVGPVCDAEIAWWQVRYNGLTGWTAEGQGNEYFTEPVQ